MTTKQAHSDADERLRRRLAAGVALLLNLAFLVALDHVMRPLARERAPWQRIAPTDVLQVRLIEETPPSSMPAPAQETPPMPEPPAPTVVERRPRARPNAPAPSRTAAAPAEASPARENPVAPVQPDVSAPVSSTPQFYERNGQVRMPDASVGAAETPFPQLPIVPTEGNPFVHRNPVPYEPTRFDKYFPSVRETLLGEVVRKATVKKAGRLPWGTYVECSWVLFFGGCGWGSPPRASIEELKAMRADPPMPKVRQPQSSLPLSPSPSTSPPPILDLSLKPLPALEVPPAPAPNGDSVPEPSR